MKIRKSDLIEIIKHTVDACGYEFVDLTYSQADKNPLLRIYIDRSEGIQIRDCQEVSKRLQDRFDRDNIIEENYRLEVSSPGVERPLRTEKDFGRNLGRDVRVKIKSDEGVADLTGEILSVNPVLKLKLQDGSEEEVQYDSIIQGTIQLKW